jgi:glucose/arabinose dehydrogenase
MRDLHTRWIAAIAILSIAWCANGNAQDCTPNSLKVKLPSGWCLEPAITKLKFPRGVLAHPDGSVWIAQMNGWSPGAGNVVRWNPKTPNVPPVVIVSNLDRPHALRFGPDQRVYVGVVGAIARLPNTPGAAVEWVIGGDSGVAGPTGKGMHPLTNFVFDAHANLIVNAGAQTNVCEKQTNQKSTKDEICAEHSGSRPTGALLHYQLTWQQKDQRPFRAIASPATVLALGLRNSMSLAVHTSGTVVQADNARDAIHLGDPTLRDEQLPHDELNIIERGKHYGWPYCFDQNRVSPEYVGKGIAQCAVRTAPWLLLPPHAASLGMAYDNNQRLPAPFTGQLLVAMHGYRKGGHRIQAFAIDSLGKPQKNVSPSELVSSWEKVGKQPTGAPVEIAIAQDGSIWLTDDRNGQLLHLKKR